MNARKTPRALYVIPLLIVALLIMMGMAGVASAAEPRTGTIPPVPLPGGRGRRWGKSTVPNTFNPSGNGLWIAPDCSTVAEGQTFWASSAEWLQSVKGAAAQGEAGALLDSLRAQSPEQVLEQGGYMFWEWSYLNGQGDPKAVLDSMVTTAAPL